MCLVNFELWSSCEIIGVPKFSTCILRCVKLIEIIRGTCGQGLVWH